MICRLAARAMPATIDQLQAMQRQTFRLQPCLRDVWHDHVLFVEDTVTGLIDPGACRTEHVCTDLARLLGSLVGDDTERWRQAVATYCQFRSLDDNELHLLAVLDRSAVVLSPLSWLQRRYIMHAAFDRNRVLPRLTGQLDRLRRIAD